jgi:chemotaxis protein methyltransferase CheR
MIQPEGEAVISPFRYTIHEGNVMASGTVNTTAPSSQGREFQFSEENFTRISHLIYDRAGIILTPKKKDMVYGRLSRRLRQLGLASFDAYLDTLVCGDGEEWSKFVGALTTHLTSFFREKYHFPILARHIAERRATGKTLLWSCAASTGEEPYSMAITAAEQFDSLFPPVSILATDVDTGVLETARLGVYPLERVNNLTERIVRRYFLRGSGTQDGLVKVRPELQQMITFRKINLLDPVWPIKGVFDAIFCRNVMIYFDRPTQRRVLTHCMKILKPDGLFFVGHSENLNYAADLAESCGNTVYCPRLVQKRGVALGGSFAEALYA